jgi:hypothetical protein
MSPNRVELPGSNKPGRIAIFTCLRSSLYWTIHILARRLLQLVIRRSSPFGNVIMDVKQAHSSGTAALAPVVPNYAEQYQSPLKVTRCVCVSVVCVCV